MDGINKSRRNGGGSWAVAACIAIPLLYVLSVGPVNWLDEHECIDDWCYVALRKFYNPLTRVSRSGTPIAGLLNRYAWLWTEEVPPFIMIDPDDPPEDEVF